MRRRWEESLNHRFEIYLDNVVRPHARNLIVNLVGLRDTRKGESIQYVYNGIPREGYISKEAPPCRETP